MGSTVGAPASDETTTSSGAFVAVCPLSELSDGEPRKEVVNGTTIAVVLTEGEVYAINDTCSHGQVSLAEGEIEGCLLECWLHGSQFDLRTGQPVSLPATDPVPVYPVKVEDDTVFVQV
ncbi:MAG TPA: non-heme iron oxygenase ferredoxin subunit [Actinomycetes bacterium]|nr:non-heme iron oxygenase ferredoxin subunit [Actinomycetes bacterium]